jgi:hypothetical protein
LLTPPADVRGVMMRPGLLLGMKEMMYVEVGMG